MGMSLSATNTKFRACFPSFWPLRGGWRGWVGILLLAAGFVAPLGAQSSKEYDLKAVFLYNFATFVEWPESARLQPGEPFVIGVLGNDPFGAVLDEVVAGEMIKGSPLQVRRLKSLAEIEGCRILFVSRSGTPPIHEVMAAVQGRPVLTVADNEHFAAGGGIIGFSTHSGRLQLHINAEAARASGLSISSKLLRVSKVLGGSMP